jgi:hypothetical protein
VHPHSSQCSFRLTFCRTAFAIQTLFCSTPGLGGVFVSDVVTQPLKHEPPLLTALINKLYLPWDFFQGDSCQIGIRRYRTRGSHDNAGARFAGVT